MSKNIVIISSSFRKNGNSELLAKAFADGTKKAGNQVEVICLSEKTIGFCKGCLACQTSGHCVIADDAGAITEKMCQSDVIVFATPIYYYEMSGQLKTMLDRANALFVRDYKFRDIYVLTSAAEAEPHTPGRAVNGIEGWIACFEKARLAGTVFAGGVTGAGEIKGHAALEKAFEMGKAV